MPTKTQIREHVKFLTLFDDVLFRKAAEDNDFCEEILRIMLNDDTLDVVSHNPQQDVTNLQGRSVILDLLCKMSNGKIVNVEVQKTDTLNHLCRVRYNSSVISANITDPGTDFDKIPELIIIYVTTFDIFKKGDVKYIVESTLRSYGDIINDGLTRIFINAEVYDETPLAKLMKVFAGDKKFIDDFPKTRERIISLTQKEGGIELMSNIIEEIFGEDLKRAREEAKKEGIQEGIQEGIKEGIQEGIKDGIKKGKNEICNNINLMIKNNCTFQDLKNFISTELQKSPS